jgi:hypothetical protein
MPTRPADTQRPPMEVLLRNLPAQHREIIVATYFRRRTAREAARDLGLSPAVAEARLYAAMRDLSVMVAASGPEHVGPRPADFAWNDERKGPKPPLRHSARGRAHRSAGSPVLALRSAGHGSGRVDPGRVDPGRTDFGPFERFEPAVRRPE